MITNGVDIVSVERIENALEKFEDKFVRKILTDNEIEIFNRRKDKILFLAGRFAAKEAIYKAYGDENLTWHQVEILNGKNGAPIVKIKDNKVNMSLSISHEKEFAIAFAVKFQSLN